MGGIHKTLLPSLRQPLYTILLPPTPMTLDLENHPAASWSSENVNRLTTIPITDPILVFILNDIFPVHPVIRYQKTQILRTWLDMFR